MRGLMSNFIYDIYELLGVNLKRLSFSLRTIFPRRHECSNGILKVNQKVKVHTHDPDKIGHPTECIPFCTGNWHGRIEIVKYDEWGRLVFYAPSAKYLEIVK